VAELFLKPCVAKTHPAVEITKGGGFDV